MYDYNDGDVQRTNFNLKTNNRDLLTFTIPTLYK